MANVKTAISMREVLFRQVCQLSRKARISRSRVISQAVEEFIERQAATAITAKLNEIYAEPDPETESWVALAATSLRGSKGNVW